MEIIQKETIKDKIFEPLYTLDSYISILLDYMEMHENIPEINHASLIIDKMDEELNKIKELVNN